MRAARPVAPQPSPFNGDAALTAYHHGLKGEGLKGEMMVAPPVDAGDARWEQERATLLAQVAALRMNLTAASKTNRDPRARQ